MAHLLRYPNAGSPTTTVTLNPSLVRIQPFQEAPIQRFLKAEDGTEYIYELSTNTEQLFEVSFIDLHEADSGSNSGVITLRAFIKTTLVFSKNTFDLTDEDGVTVTCRYLSGFDSIREGGGSGRDYQRYSGSLLFRKTV